MLQEQCWERWFCAFFCFVALVSGNEDALQAVMRADSNVQKIWQQPIVDDNHLSTFLYTNVALQEITKTVGEADRVRRFAFSFVFFCFFFVFRFLGTRLPPPRNKHSFALPP
jgi:hypothetical protein